MAYDVQESFWLYWQPGQQCHAMTADETETGNVFARDPAEYAVYMKWAKECDTVIRLTLQALASNASPINSSTAMTYQGQERLAQKINRSSRQLRTILQRLAWADELAILPCDGRYCFSRHHHTRHYLLYLPAGAPFWDVPGVLDRRMIPNKLRRTPKDKPRAPRTPRTAKKAARKG